MGTDCTRTPEVLGSLSGPQPFPFRATAFAKMRSPFEYPNPAINQYLRREVGLEV